MIREWSPGLCVFCDGMGKGCLLQGGSWLTCWNHRYPSKMIPAIRVIVCTTATNDKDARLLLSSLGVPFYGKHVN